MDDKTTVSAADISAIKSESYDKGWDDGRRDLVLEQRGQNALGKPLAIRLRAAEAQYNGLTAAEIGNLLGMRGTPSNVRMIGKELRRLGWDKRQRRRGSKVVWAWVNTSAVAL